MKFIITSLLLITSYLSFGQALRDTIVVVDSDSLVLYRGDVLKEPEIKNGPLNAYISNRISKALKDYLLDKGSYGLFVIEAVVDTIGNIKGVRLYKGEDNIVSKEFIEIIKYSEWKPAISKEGIPVNRRIFIPIRV